MILDLVKLTTNISHRIIHGRNPLSPHQRCPNYLPYEACRRKALFTLNYCCCLVACTCGSSCWLHREQIHFLLNAASHAKAAQSNTHWSEHRHVSLLFSVGMFSPAHTPTELLPNLQLINCQFLSSMTSSHSSPLSQTPLLFLKHLIFPPLSSPWCQEVCVLAWVPYWQL